MKPRPEYRNIFNSPAVLYRIIHTISTQKYRLPVRRYIFDLFNVELNYDTVKTFIECEKSLRLTPSVEPVSVQNPPRVISIFSHRVTASDESDMDEEISELQGSRRKYNSTRRPVSLRPRRTVVGFD